MGATGGAGRDRTGAIWVNGNPNSLPIKILPRIGPAGLLRSFHGEVPPLQASGVSTKDKEV